MNCLDLQTGSPSAGLRRRQFLKLGLMAGAAVVVPQAAWAAATSTKTARRGFTERSLSFFHTHTGEELESLYCWRGHYVRSALADIDYHLRDFRTGDVKPIDTRLLDLLHRLKRQVGTSEPFHVISGYRCAATNAMLHEKGGGRSGVATRSLHMEGKAIDIRVPGVPLDDLRAAAERMRLGGVGYYPASDFVHVDVGRVRSW